ncbi:Ig-like domain repeat protein [Paenibacillus glycinis]|uniref:Ig-like domain repeat protein n=1 Tax=Paenibacillus glycinis TaxID=2697035 RepID=UPI0038B3CC84
MSSLAEEVDLTGAVDFIDGDDLIGSAPVVDGTAELSVSSLSAGFHMIKAVYNGDNHYEASSYYGEQTVDLKSSSTLLTGNESETQLGDPVTLTAEVSSLDHGTATGSVIFLDGNEQLGQVQLSEGQATYTTSELGVGVHNLNAAYAGDDTFSDSVSDIYSLQVNPRTNAKLSRLKLQGISVEQEFEPNVASYSAAVDNAVGQVTVRAMAEDAKATIAINGLPGTVSPN